MCMSSFLGLFGRVVAFTKSLDCLAIALEHQQNISRLDGAIFVLIPFTKLLAPCY